MEVSTAATANLLPVSFPFGLRLRSTHSSDWELDEGSKAAEECREGMSESEHDDASRLTGDQRKLN